MPQTQDKSLAHQLKNYLVSMLMITALVASAPFGAVVSATNSSGTCAAEDSYILNKNGSYENSKCSWNPKDGTTKIKAKQNYSYNPESGAWDNEKWRYDKNQGKYVENVPAPTPQNQRVTRQPIQDKGNGYQTPNDIEQPIKSTPKTGGNSSSTNKKLSDKAKAQLSNYNDTEISNKVTSNATSGDATVANNTKAGNATSGDASATVNLINMLKSGWDWGAKGLTTFVADIFGNVFGDIVLDPNKIAGSGGGDKKISSERELELDINNKENTSINNEIEIDANSGNANVTGNTVGGSAKSGDANAIANIINLIGSSISSGDSFVGMLNIHGNLNGDILLPPGVIDQILAANSNAEVNIKQNGDIDVNNNSNQSINNNISTIATSGNANVEQNTSAGNATSGEATNKIAILNLTGREVNASNSLLVFVNVFGKWVGLIMDAPKGTTAAAVGGNVEVNRTSELKADIEAESNQTINNDVSLNARSGDANVSQNTVAGDASSGNANTAANITNIINSSFKVDDWFGVLFINVFGEWIGSFGKDTEAGERPRLNTVPVVKKPLEKSIQSNNKPQENSYSSLGSTQDSPGQATPFEQLLTSVGDNDADSQKDQSSSATTSRELPDKLALSSSEADESPKQKDEKRKESPAPGWIISAGGFMLGASLIGTERLLSGREARRRSANF